ncbi:MAG: hypothetical protein SVU32_09650 [Candidatus Nanohaloarchaea archaeon]|nr:hypothetical protein [Candidatus Nanohaloarchaea archaeon]
MDVGEVAYGQVADDLDELDDKIEDVQQTMHNFYQTEHSSKREERIFTTEQGLERKIKKYAEQADDIASSYGEIEVTASPGERGYHWQRAVAEEIARIKNRAHFLQRLEDAYPDLNGLEDLPPLY